MARKAYVLTTDKTSDRTLCSKERLDQIGFDVLLVQHIPNENKFLSNRLSMQHIYDMIINSEDEWAYVFENDIDVLEPITLSEIRQYESISKKLFYLGICTNNVTIIRDSGHTVNLKRVMTVAGNGFGLHAIGLSKAGAAELLEYSKVNQHPCMDVVLSEFVRNNPTNIVRYDLESYIEGHRGIIFQDRNKFPSEIGN